MTISRIKNVVILMVMLSILAVSVMSEVIAGNDIDTQPGWHEQQLTHDKLQRYFRYYIPGDLKENSAIVLLFHGGTQSMRKIFRKRAGGSQEWQTLADQNGFLLIAPNGVRPKNGDTGGDRQKWNDCRVFAKGTRQDTGIDDVGFVDELLDWIVANFSVDQGRVYVTGASNGGMMSLRLITELSDRIAAAATFIANQPVESECTSPEQPVPLLMMMATDDPLMLWQGGQINGKGPQMRSAIETRDYWLKVNRADKDKVEVTRLPDMSKEDDSTIIKYVFPAKAGGQPLWFYEIRNAGHTMPSIKHDVPYFARMLLVNSQNKDIEGVHEAWNFLQQFSK